MGGNPSLAAAAKLVFAEYVNRGDLTIISSMVTPDNVEDLLASHHAPESFDYISVDIDQHTTHVWRALRRKCRVACIEYNSAIPPNYSMEVPYVADAEWDGTNWFGGSLKLIERLGKEKELSLVGCDSFGINAYLVSSAETSDRFCEPFTAENHYESPKYHLIGQTGHRPSLVAHSWISRMPDTP